MKFLILGINGSGQGRVVEFSSMEAARRRYPIHKGYLIQIFRTPAGVPSKKGNSSIPPAGSSPSRRPGLIVESGQASISGGQYGPGEAVESPWASDKGGPA